MQKGKFTVVESLQRPQLKSDEEQVCEQVLSFLHPNVNLIKHSLAFVNWTTMGKIQTGYKCNNKSKWKDDWKIENNEVKKLLKKWKTMLRPEREKVRQRGSGAESRVRAPRADQGLYMRN